MGIAELPLVGVISRAQRDNWLAAFDEVVSRIIRRLLFYRGIIIYIWGSIRLIIQDALKISPHDFSDTSDDWTETCSEHKTISFQSVDEGSRSLVFFKTEKYIIFVQHSMGFLFSIK